MIGYGNIDIEPSAFIGTRRNVDLLVAILNPCARGQKVAVEVENDRDFDVDRVLRKIKKDQPCPTIAIIPKDHEKDAWRFQKSFIEVWLWDVKCKWKCGWCNSIFTTNSSRQPDKCQNQKCKKGGKITFEGIEHDDKPFTQASNNPAMTWAEIQEELRIYKEIHQPPPDFVIQRFEEPVEKPLKSNWSIRILHPDKPIQKCNVFFNGELLPWWDKVVPYYEKFIHKGGGGNVRIPVEIEKEGADVDVMDGKKLLKRLKFKDIPEAKP